MEQVYETGGGDIYTFRFENKNYAQFKMCLQLSGKYVENPKEMEKLFPHTITVTF